MPKLKDLIDKAETFQIKEIQSRLDTQKDAARPDPSVVKSCLVDLQHIKEVNRQEDRAAVESAITLAQELLSRLDTPPPSPELFTIAGESKDLRIPINVTNLSEAEVTANGSEVTVRLIESGWSKNERYYPAKVIESLPAIMDKGKVFLNHLLTKEQQESGRKLRDWAAQIRECWVTHENGKAVLKGKIHIFDKPDGGWLQERVAKFPNEVGLSISAFAKVTEGTAEGKKGNIVEAVKKVESFDFVHNPAAGGRVERIAAGEDWFPTEYEAEPTDSPALRESLTDYITKRKGQDQLWDLKYALCEGFKEIANSVTDYNTDAKKKAAFGQLLDEFKVEVMKLPLLDMFKENTVEGETPKTTTKEDTNEVDWKTVTPADVAQNAPQVYNAIVEAAKLQIAESTASKEKDQRLTTLEADNLALKQKIDASEAAKVAEAWKQTVATKLTDSKLPERAVTEQFKSDLQACKNESELEARIKDRQELYAAAATPQPTKVKGNGPDATRDPLSAPATVVEGEAPKETLTDEAAAGLFRN